MIAEPRLIVGGLEVG